MKRYETDLTKGPVVPGLLFFMLPIAISGILQLLFNTADTIVVGRFSGSAALAAVGSTAIVIQLLTQLFTGTAIGANVLAARYYGAHDDRRLALTVHTSTFTSTVMGLLLVPFGFVVSRPLLIAMSTPADVLPLAVTYVRLYFLGMPAFLFYTFGSSILRAVGDTKRPLYYLLLSGAVNVVLNLFFVVILHMSVAGVAIATVLSQYLSAVLVLKAMLTADSAYQLDLGSFRRDRFRREGFNSPILGQILRMGIPAGLQGCVFCFSGIIIQSSINSFGTAIVAGSTAANTLESFSYTMTLSFGTALLSFVAQNDGAGRKDRVLKATLSGVAMSAGIAALITVVFLKLGPTLLSIYSSDPDVIAGGMVRFSVIAVGFAACGVQDAFPGFFRGLGMAILPTVISLTEACGLRILWIFTYFRMHHEPGVLYACYPITWCITGTTYIICFLIVWNRYKKTARTVVGTAES